MEEKKELLNQDERVVEIELERLRVLKDDEAVVSMLIQIYNDKSERESICLQNEVCNT